MSIISDTANISGDIEMTIEYADGRREVREYKNTILKAGRRALASIVANDYGDTFNLYVDRMIFGSNGTAGGVPKFVNEDRNGLFGITGLSKSVIASKSDTTATFTSVIAYDEANSIAINEMALQMASDDLYSMRTFPDLNKTSEMQLILVWKISYA